MAPRQRSLVHVVPDMQLWQTSDHVDSGRVVGRFSVSMACVTTNDDDDDDDDDGDDDDLEFMAVYHGLVFKK